MAKILEDPFDLPDWIFEVKPKLVCEVTFAE
jgi:hypothetical protein